MAAAAQFRDVARLLAVIAAVLAELAVWSHGAGASRMRAFLIHRVPLRPCRAWTADPVYCATASRMASSSCRLLPLSCGSTSVHSSSECWRPPGPPRPTVIAGMPRLMGMLASVLLNVNEGVP